MVQAQCLHGARSTCYRGQFERGGYGGLGGYELVVKPLVSGSNRSGL